MIRTYGLTHIGLLVNDPDRSLRFYRELFGVEEYFRDAESIQAKTPGAHDVLAFVRAGDDAQAGARGGIEHFGFRLIDPGDVDAAVETALAAGGTLLRRGEFAPGFPYAFVLDPDGYEIEIWYE